MGFADPPGSQLAIGSTWPLASPRHIRTVATNSPTMTTLEGIHTALFSVGNSIPPDRHQVDIDMVRPSTYS
jgi:hypothetical protein